MSKSKTIIFRVSDEAFARIERAAKDSNKSANDWCRDIAESAAGAENNLSPNERLIFEELAKTRYLVGIGLGLLASKELTKESWNQTKNLVDEKGEQIADALLKKRR